ncbi:MAG: 6-carboxytetrahydropterin synthase [Campylobacteraceae bacterium]|nr:6-carboxytetrahydropterin synthase [Campylobacteraceae bacterium]
MENKVNIKNGHNYVITIHLKTKDLGQYGFIKDCNMPKPVEKYTEETLDHRHLIVKK